MNSISNNNREYLGGDFSFAPLHIVDFTPLSKEIGGRSTTVAKYSSSSADSHLLQLLYILFSVKKQKNKKHDIPLLNESFLYLPFVLQLRNMWTQTHPVAKGYPSPPSNRGQSLQLSLAGSRPGIPRCGRQTHLTESVPNSEPETSGSISLSCRYSCTS